jgi:archaellum component FlaC
LTNDIDKQRKRLEDVSAELSEVKLELIKEREDRQLAEHKINNLRKLLKMVVEYVKSHCPDVIKQFREEYGPLADEISDEVE